jgi:UDP-glucose 4-epimerase
METNYMLKVPVVDRPIPPCILVLGGAGYIGSHVNLALAERGYKTVVLDNLVYGHRESVLCGELVEGNMADFRLVDDLFSRFQFDAVMHFAAYAYVGESVTDPAKYYMNNVANTLALLEVMRRHATRAIVFSSTCATYGVPSTVPIPEDHSQNPINPYGASKAMVERILKDYAMAYGFHHAILRYFNAAGADLAGRIGEWHDPETHLIPLVLRAGLGQAGPVTILGTDYETPDGTCIRDYIHVSDLAVAHILAMEKILSERCSVIYNLGTGNGTSVREIVNAADTVIGRPVPVIVGSRRPGDPPRLVGDARRAMQELGWKPRVSDIQTILSSAWNWELRHARNTNQFLTA